MRFFLISDNVDTRVGLRLAGIEGAVVHGEEELRKAFNNAVSQPDVGMILITANLVPLCREAIDDVRINRSLPLVAEIPDRHGNGSAAGSLARAVQETIGIRL